jgi:rare lipoprotein A
VKQPGASLVPCIAARITLLWLSLAATILLTILLLTACSHPKQARVDVPPPPASAPESSSSESPAASRSPSAAGSAAEGRTEAGTDVRAKPGRAPASATSDDLAEPAIPAGATPLATEIGRASWYGPPYHNRRGSNGEVYNMHAMTAAHRTLPLGSIVRVTNLKTGHAALVRITDRGPFIPGRVLDLSLAAARKVDVYQPGIAEVKVEVMQAPVPIDTGGKWAVQIGGFPDESAASDLADHLTRRYRSAKVLRFASPAGDWWIRVRVLDDDRQRAQELVAETQTTEGAVFLVRLD